MLELTIRGADSVGYTLFDESTSRFITAKTQTILLEHNLLSLSAWESKWKVPFLGSQHTSEQTIDYIRCMTVTPDVDPNLYFYITGQDIAKVQEYIDDSQTATWFNDKNVKPDHKIITSERLYSWMVSLNIPFECQTWHLSRLLILIRACNELNNPPKKMSRDESAAYIRQQRALRHAKSGKR